MSESPPSRDPVGQPILDDFELFRRLAAGSPGGSGGGSDRGEEACAAPQGRKSAIDDWISGGSGLPSITASCSGHDLLHLQQPLPRQNSNLLSVEFGSPGRHINRLDKRRSRSQRLHGETSPSDELPPPLPMMAAAADGRRPRYGSARERREFDPEFSGQPQQSRRHHHQQQHQPPQPHHQQLERVRSFRRTRRGLVNEGDLLVRSAHSSCSLNSSAASSDLELAAAATAPAGVTRRGQSCRVQVIGAARVGKTALCDQFMSSECRALDAACGDDEPTDEEGTAAAGSASEKVVTVLLDGEQYHVTFLDTEDDDEAAGTYFLDADAYIVVFAIDSRRSFAEAKRLLVELAGESRRGRRPSAALMLAANKADLVRGREVAHEEAKALASVHGARYAEVSAALNHGVDELLVSVLSEIRSCQMTRQRKERAGKASDRGDDGVGCAGPRPRLRSPRRVVGEFIRKHFSSKSCDNLQRNA